MKEVWKPIRGYDQSRRYEVSNLGRIRGIVFRGRSALPFGILSQYDNKGHEYLRIGLRRSDGIQELVDVHVVVARAFCGKKPTLKHEVNHKDLDKHHNFAINLEWMTSKGNSQHFFTSDLYKNQHPKGMRFGTTPPNATLTWDDVLAIRRAYTGKYGEQIDLAKQYGVHRDTIRRIIERLCWSFEEDDLQKAR